jgi:hypothetical protein
MVITGDCTPKITGLLKDLPIIQPCGTFSGIKLQHSFITGMRFAILPDLLKKDPFIEKRNDR